ncbi:MAG: hypothetical protein WBF58_17945, partial [Xanthobacteraceae bacterium]
DREFLPVRRSSVLLQPRRDAQHRQRRRVLPAQYETEQRRILQADNSDSNTDAIAAQVRAARHHAVLSAFAQW